MHDQETFEEIVIQERPYPDEQPPAEPQPEHPEPPDEPPKIDPETRRLGKFYVSDVVIEYELDRARKILAGFVVVRCEHMFYMHAFDYIAIHPTVTYSSGQWYFICGLFYPSTYMKIFVNGVWVEDDVGIPAAIHDSTVPFTFGSHNEGSFFDGLMTMNILFALLANETTQETVIKSLYQHTRVLFGVRS